MRRTHKSAEFGWVVLRVPIPPFTIYVMNLSFIVSVIRHVSTFKHNTRLSKGLHFCSLVSFIYRRGRFSGQLRQGQRHSFITNCLPLIWSSAPLHITVALSLLIFTFAFNGSYWPNKTCFGSGFPLNAEWTWGDFPSASPHELTISP